MAVTPKKQYSFKSTCLFIQDTECLKFKTAAVALFSISLFLSVFPGLKYIRHNFLFSKKKYAAAKVATVNENNLIINTAVTEVDMKNRLEKEEAAVTKYNRKYKQRLIEQMVLPRQVDRKLGKLISMSVNG